MKITFEGSIDEIMSELAMFMNAQGLTVVGLEDGFYDVHPAEEFAVEEEKLRADQEIEEEDPEAKPAPKKKKAPAKKKKDPEPEDAEEPVAEAEDEAEAEEEAPDVRKANSTNAADTKKKALSLLIQLYNGTGTRDPVKTLLEKYDVKKFSEIPEDRADELLADAKKIEKDAA